MALEAKLNQFSRLEVKDQCAQFSSLASELVAGVSLSNLKVLAQKVLSEDVSVQVAKPVLIHLATAIKALSGDEFYDLALLLVTSIKQHPSASLFDEADYILRDSLFSHCVSCEEYTDAAQYLAGANLDSTTKVFTDLEKVDIYIKCAGTIPR